MTLVDLLKRSAQLYGDKPALTMRRGFRTVELSYCQLLVMAQQVSLLLQQQGVEPGNNVVLLAPNSPFFVAVYFGTLMRGCTIVPLNVQSTPEFVNKALAHTQARILFKHQFYKHDLPNGVTGFDIDFLDEIVAPYDASTYKPVPIDEKSTAQIMYTSGTTGEPKGVMLTHANIMSNVVTLAGLIHPESGKDRALSVLPLTHILEQTAGLFLPLYKGIQIVYAHSPAAIAQLMREYRITKMVAVPEFLYLVRSRIVGDLEKRGLLNVFNRVMRVSRAINRPRFSRILFWPVLRSLGGKLDTIASGGAPLDVELAHWWHDLGIYILQAYGLTETSPAVTANTYTVYRLGSVGKVIPGVQIKLAPDGEILVKGPNVFVGYYKNPEKTREAFTDDGWFKTDDAGVLDADGFLYIKGRKKYMILGPGGQNVFPEDIEEQLNRIPGVKDSAVIGLEHEPGVFEIHAVLLLSESIDNPQTVIDQANAQLASYQHVGGWSIWPEQDFPRSATRKVRKEIVREFLTKHRPPQATQAARVTPLVRLLSQVTGVAEQRIGPDSQLVRDLKLDSLKRIELVARIEQDMRVVIDEANITTTTTVAQLQETIDKKEPVKPERPLAHWPRSPWACVIRLFLQTVFALFAWPFVRVKACGLEHMEKLRGPVIFMPNHLSNWDGAVLARALPWRWRARLSFAAALDVVYQDYWYVAWLSDLIFNTFPFPRREGQNIKLGLTYFGRMLDWGYNVAVFPEGKISLSGQLEELKDGAGLVATQMDVAIIPVKIEGIREIFPYDTFIPRALGRVTVTFGRPLSFSRRQPYHEATQQIEQALRKL